MAGERAGDTAGKVDKGMRQTPANGARPSENQLRYLRGGLAQAGGKLPLFDANGKAYPAQTVRSCIERGWAEPWFDNPLKPDWLVCRLTEAGRAAASRHES
jgi:hypothetical protein